jgi:quercetin dioxygenase-like cupin family protein
MRRPLSILVALALLIVPVVVLGQSGSTPMPSASPASSHALFAPSDLHWQKGPLPGTKAAVLEGDPATSGPFTMRVLFPADTKVPPHFHPAVEHVTVISGTFEVGLGEKFDAEKLTSLPAGSFAVMQARTPHFAHFKDETVVQLHGIGPWGITYVNPDDDPTKAPSASGR